MQVLNGRIYKVFEWREKKEENVFIGCIFFIIGNFGKLEKRVVIGRGSDNRGYNGSNFGFEDVFGKVLRLVSVDSVMDVGVSYIQVIM